MKIFLVIIVIICIGAAALLTGCKQKPIDPPTEDIITGGKKDNTDPDAPKEIRSDELISFETDFFRNSDFVYEKERGYRFKLKKTEGDVYVIAEGYDDVLKCETDGAFAAKLQQLLREYDLISLNGIDKQTYGLPEEYGPYWLSAEYASGEKLYFSMDGDPNAAWTSAVLDLFAKEFGAHGINDLLPPKEESMMTRFSLEYISGDVKYCCIETEVPLAEEHYIALQKIVEETELIRYQNGSIFSGNFDYDNTPQYYEFYIEYESGKRMSAFSDDPEECERFKPIAERFAQYYKEYIEQ